MRGADLGPAVKAARVQGVPEEALSRVLSLGARYAVSPDHLATIITIMTAAHKDELPVSTLAEKLEEGLAKRVAPVQIEAALLDKVDDFRFVRELARGKSVVAGGDSGPTPSELARLAGVLEMGLSREDLARFLESAPGAPWPMVVIGLENMALLGQIRFNRGLAEQVVQAGLRGRGFDDSWGYLSRAVVAARDRGNTDEAIAGAALQALNRKETIRGMMTLLGFTDRDLRRGPQAGADGVGED